MPQPAWLELTLRTLLVAGVGTLAAAPLAIALGYYLSRRCFRGKALLEAFIALPMVLPPVAVGLFLLLLFSPRFAPGRLLAETLGMPVVFTWKAGALAAGTVAFPLFVRACQQAFAEVPRRLEQVAASLGAGPVRVFAEVTLPLARRGVVYGMLLAFTRGLGEFGATNIVAGSIHGKTQTLSLAIYEEIILGRYGPATALCAVSLLLALAAMILAEAWLHPRRSL